MKFAEFEKRMNDIKELFADHNFEKEELTKEEERKKGYYLSCIDDIERAIKTFDYANSPIIAKGIPQLTEDKRSIQLNGIRINQGDTVEQELKDINGNTGMYPIIIDDLLAEGQPLEEEIIIRKGHEFTRKEHAIDMCCDRCGKVFDLLDYNGMHIYDIGCGSVFDNDINLQLCLDCTDNIIADILCAAEQTEE